MPSQDFSAQEGPGARDRRSASGLDIRKDQPTFVEYVLTGEVKKNLGMRLGMFCQTGLI